MDDNLYALDPNGQLVWKFPTGGDLYSCPVLASDGTIYIGCYDNNNLYAINPNGTVKWVYPTGGSVYCSPAIGNDGAVFVGCGDGYMYAVNPDGTLRWKALGGTGGSGLGSPAINSTGIVFSGCSDGKMYAFDPDNGNVIWTYQAGARVTQSASIGEDDSVYFACNDGYIYKLDSSGSLQWRTYVGMSICSIALDAWGTAYLATYGTTGGYNKAFYALDINGNIKWSYGLAPPYVHWSSPSIGEDGTVYIGSGPRVYAFGPGG
jgi:outer membrane protein assembly factor BamB